MKYPNTEQAIRAFVAKFGKASPTKQGGYSSKRGIVERPRRSYAASNQRIVQAQRHIATQLYFYFKHETNTAVVEIQLMFMGDKLLIGANTAAASKALFRLLQDPEQTYHVLTQSYGKTPHTKTNRLTSRFSKKNLRGSNLLMPLLAKGEPDLVDLADGYQALDKLYNGGRVFVVTDTRSPKAKYNGRHIEEKFIDILNALRKVDWYVEVAIIAGMKRPCVTCSGRMRSFQKRDLNYQLIYGKFPSRLWLSRLLSQPKSAQKQSMKILRTSYEYTAATLGGAFATESDSDGDDEAVANEQKVIVISQMELDSIADFFIDRVYTQKDELHYLEGYGGEPYSEGFHIHSRGENYIMAQLREEVVVKPGALTYPEKLRREQLLENYEPRNDFGMSFCTDYDLIDISNDNLNIYLADLINGFYETWGSNRTSPWADFEEEPESDGDYEDYANEPVYFSEQDGDLDIEIEPSDSDDEGESPVPKLTDEDIVTLGLSTLKL